MSIPGNANFQKTTALVTVLAFGLTLSPAALASQAAQAAAESAVIDINHDPLPCVAPEYAPKVDAAVVPGPQYDRGYVYFRAGGTEDYYYARMDGPAQTLAAVLPRPLPETRAIDYYLRAYDTQAATKKKGEWTPPVVPGKTCKASSVPVGPKGAGLTIGLTKAGQNPYPPGFNPKDIARIILVTGALVGVAVALKAAGGGAAAAGGGAGAGGAAGAGAAGATGISTGVIVGGVAAAAAGVAVAASSKGSSSTPTPQPTPTPTVPPLRFLEADASWSGLGDVDVQLLAPNGQAIGQKFFANCESTANRTERVVQQGTNLANGTYRVVLAAATCGVGTPAVIATVLSVQSDTGPKCANVFVNVPVGGSVEGCQFTLP